MTKNYYLDTSIWLDFFEDRDEPNFSKGKLTHKLLNKIIKEDSKIIYTNLIFKEMRDFGYTYFELKYLFKPFNKILIYTRPTKKQYGKAKDLAAKRKVPLVDAIHALIARDNKAVLITRDHHFKRLLDITKSKRPEDLI